jgi:hypothetical protein
MHRIASQRILGAMRCPACPALPQAAHFRAILAGDLEFDDEDWDDVSASAKVRPGWHHKGSNISVNES